jgi:ABC-type multidrug transport system fused ATPase/permease subunit
MPLMTIINLTLLFWISPEVFYLSIILFLFYVLIFHLTKNKISKLEEEYNEKRKTISEFLVEKINFIIEIKKNNKEEKEKNILQKNKINAQDKSFYNKIKFNFFTESLRNLLYIFGVSGSLFLSVYLYGQGKITLGEIASINMYVMYLNWNYGWFIQILDRSCCKFNSSRRHRKTPSPNSRKLRRRKKERGSSWGNWI